MGSNDEINNYISRLRRQCELNVAIDEGNNISLREKSINHRGLVSIYYL